jgi:predicted ATPase
MNSFDRITVRGFRRLENLDLEMRPFTVLIGANGSGKTSFLDAFSLLSASANGDLQKVLQRRGGLSEILTRGKAQKLELGVWMSVLNQSPLKYNLELIPQGYSYQIKSENLNQKRKEKAITPFDYIDSHGLDINYFDQAKNKKVKPDWDHNPLETSLSQVPKMFREPESLRKNLATCMYYSSGSLEISEKSPVRLPQTMRPAKLPGVNGENLVSCLYDLRESDHDRFERVESIVSAAFPDFVRFNFPPVAAGTLSMTWTDRNFTQPIYIHELSEGTLRFLWLITLLQSQELTTITLLDEPEVSLHPELLQHLVGLMREASERTQLIVATHSDRLIRFLEPKEILVCDVEDGVTSMTWGDSFPLDKWLEEYSLDQLWSMNIFGGRP